jgi:serine/threonine-protein kinase
MDFIAGTSLAALTRQGPLDPERAARCLSAVARAVQYLHEHGIIHRDLKPSNILLDEAGAPYVTDFGLAKVFSDEDERTQTGVILGTAGYMPPEQAAGRVSDTSPRSDVYSLGAILYETLTGRPPFREDNQLNTILQVLEGEPTLPNQLNAKVPPELERICLKCLEKAPERRYASAAALANDLDRYLRCEEIEARPAGLADRIRRWVRRETGLAARLAIMAAVVTIFQVAHFLLHRPWDYHFEIKIAFVVWAVLAFIFQRLLRREKTAPLARLAWAVTDPVILTYVLYSLDDAGPTVVGYPVLIVASGLWFNMRLVMISTIGCIVSYAALVAIRGNPTTDMPYFPLIFVTALIVIAGIVAFQVHRVRTLSRYFEQTQPPETEKPGPRL